MPRDPFRTSLPAGSCPFNDTDVIRCDATGGIARMVNGSLHSFSGESYASWGSPTPDHHLLGDCGALALCANGGQMPMNAQGTLLGRWTGRSTGSCMRMAHDCISRTCSAEATGPQGVHAM